MPGVMTTRPPLAVQRNWSFSSRMRAIFSGDASLIGPSPGPLVGRRSRLLPRRHRVRRGGPRQPRRRAACLDAASAGRLRTLWAAPSRFRATLPRMRRMPVIDMDGDRHGGLGIDADQADDGAEIDNAV